MLHMLTWGLYAVQNIAHNGYIYTRKVFEMAVTKYEVYSKDIKSYFMYNSYNPPNDSKCFRRRGRGGSLGSDVTLKSSHFGTI